MASIRGTRPSFLALLVGAVLVAPLAGIGGGVASADAIGCGTQLLVPGSYQLSQDLQCAGGDGIVVGGGVSLDLNGHTVAGPGVSGIRVLGASATVTNTSSAPGTVTGFLEGVTLDGSRGATVNRLTLVGNGRGINFAVASENLVSGNLITRSTSDGIRLGISGGNTIRNNAISGNGSGVGLADASNGNLITGNDVSKNRNFGVSVFCGSDANTISGNSITKTTGGEAHGIIVRSGSDGTQVTGNGVNLNGADGIHVDQSGNCQNSADDVVPQGTLIRGNAANRNGDDGIDDEPADAVIAGNTANGNGDYGIYASNTCDGEGNVAKNNAGPAQTSWAAC